MSLHCPIFTSVSVYTFYFQPAAFLTTNQNDGIVKSETRGDYIWIQKYSVIFVRIVYSGQNTICAGDTEAHRPT